MLGEPALSTIQLLVRGALWRAISPACSAFALSFHDGAGSPGVTLRYPRYPAPPMYYGVNIVS